MNDYLTKFNSPIQPKEELDQLCTADKIKKIVKLDMFLGLFYWSGLRLLFVPRERLEFHHIRRIL